MEQLPIIVVKEFSYAGASLYRLTVPSAFDGTTGFDVDTDQNLSSGYAGSDCLGRVWSWKWRRWSWSGCEVGLPLCSVVICALSGTGSDAKLLELKPQGWG